MRGSRRISVSLVLCVLISGLAVPPSLQALDVSVAAPGPATTPSPEPPAWRVGAASHDDQVGERPDTPRLERLDPALAARSAVSGSDQLVTVELLGEENSVRAAVEDAGGDVRQGGGGLYLVDLPTSALSAVAATDGVQFVQTPLTPLQRTEGAARIERGVVQSSVSGRIGNWHRGGETGAGVKVGIIGLFDPALLAAEIAAGELGPVPSGNTRCVTNGSACPFGTPGQTWGNSLAELVADGAPDASLLLAELGTRTDYYSTIDWFASKGVSIVVNPLIWPYDGPGNGTGISAAIVDYAVSKGIAWFNTAGELAATTDATSFNGGYWRGQWSDPDNDRFLNFSGSDEGMAVYCGYLLGLRWSDWSGGATDYDLFIADYRRSSNSYGTIKLLSGTVQGFPLEGISGVSLCNTNAAAGPVYDTNKDGFVSLWVQRKSTSSAASAVGDTIELGVAYGWLEHANSPGSAGIAFADSSNPGMATVGGENAFPFMARSGWGPTNDGRIKPTFVAPLCSPTSPNPDYQWNCGDAYFGSDGSAAYAAGIAATAHGALQFPTPKALVLYMRDQADNPWRVPNTFGSGTATLVEDPPPAFHKPGKFVPNSAPVRLVDTRSGLGVPAAGPLKADGTLVATVPLNESYGYTAVVLNIAVVNGAGYGWLSAYPHGWSYPGATSILNYDAGQNRANMIVLPIGGSRKIDVYSSSGGHVIVDFVGVMRRDADHGLGYPESGDGRFRPLAPFRLHDSAACGAATCPKYAPGTYVDIPLAGQADPADALNRIPENATAVALSVTVDSPTANGYASVLPGGVSTVSTSNLNFDAGKSATTMVFAPLNATGAARVFLSVGAHVQVDVLGWFTATTNIGDPVGMFVPLTPVRALDTRQPPLSKPIGGASVPIDLTDVGVPAESLAALLNIVSVQHQASGEVQASALAPSSPHAVRSLSYTMPSRPVAAATTSALEDGTMVLTPSTTTHLVADLTGYWRGPDAPMPEGSVVRVTQTWDGSPLNATKSTVLAVSDDGGTVLFKSNATNLVQSPIGTGTYVWRRADDSVTEFPYRIAEVVMSGDGSTFAFNSSQQLLPADIDDPYTSLYVTTLEPGNLEILTDLRIAPNPGGGFGVSKLTISRDGMRIAYSVDQANVRTLRWYDRGSDTEHILGEGWNDRLLFHPSGTALLASSYRFETSSTRITVYAIPTGTSSVSNVKDIDLSELTGWSDDKSTLSARNPLHEFHYTVGLPAGNVQFLRYPDMPFASELTGKMTGDMSEMLVVSWTAVSLCLLGTVTCEKVNRTWNGDQPNNVVSNERPAAMISTDGRFVAYATSATNVLDESPGTGNIYIVDRSLAT